MHYRQLDVVLESQNRMRQADPSKHTVNAGDSRWCLSYVKRLVVMIRWRYGAVIPHTILSLNDPMILLSKT